MRTLIDAYEFNRQFRKAELLCRERAAELRKRCTRYRASLEPVLFTISACLMKQSKYKEAEVAFRESEANRRMSRAPRHTWQSFNKTSILGAILAGQKRFVEAEPLLVGGYQGMRDRLDKIPPMWVSICVVETLERVIRMYEDWGKPKVAAKWKSELIALQRTLRKRRPVAAPRPTRPPVAALKPRDREAS